MEKKKLIFCSAEVQSIEEDAGCYQFISVPSLIAVISSTAQVFTRVCAWMLITCGVLHCLLLSGAHASYIKFSFPVWWMMLSISSDSAILMIA